jgi:hypothetical protein
MDDIDIVFAVVFFVIGVIFLVSGCT